MQANQFTNAADALAFVMAGNAYITIRSTKSGQRFTFRIAAEKEKGEVHFVSLLTGSDNTGDYSYLGIIRQGITFAVTKKSRISADAPSAKGFAWVFKHLVKGEIGAGLEIWHEGRCGRCGRMLTVPESLARGIGPDCAGKMGFVAEAVEAPASVTNDRPVRSLRALTAELFGDDHEPDAERIAVDRAEASLWAGAR